MYGFDFDNLPRAAILDMRDDNEEGLPRDLNKIHIRKIWPDDVPEWARPKEIALKMEEDAGAFKLRKEEKALISSLPKENSIAFEKMTLKDWKLVVFFAMEGLCAHYDLYCELGDLRDKRSELERAFGKPEPTCEEKRIREIFRDDRVWAYHDPYKALAKIENILSGR
jgi:hypothetical protein